MKEGDEAFEKAVGIGVVIAFVLSAIVALLIIGALALGLVWLWKEVL